MIYKEVFMNCDSLEDLKNIVSMITMTDKNEFKISLIDKETDWKYEV